MSKFVKFVKENKKIIGIVSSVVVVAGVAVGVVCATADKKESTPKTTKEVATSTVAKEENEVNVVEVKESDLEKAQKEVKDAINQDYFAKEDGVEVYCKKDADSKVVKTLKYNESILVYGKVEGNWYLVDVDGEPGYISNEKDPLSAYDIEKKKADDEAAKKAQEEAEKQRKAAEQAVAQKQQAQAQQSQSSSNQSQQQTQQSQQQQTQQPQPQQTGYTEGYDASMTQQLYNCLISNTRLYYGAQCGTFDGILNSVATGSMSTSDAVNKINSMSWQEDAHSVNACYPNTTATVTAYGTKCVQKTFGNVDYLTIAENFYTAIGTYANVVAYRHSDGSITVTTLATQFMVAY